MTPKRIQRKRTKGWEMPPNTVCVTRPGKWGNPFRVGVTTTVTTFDKAGLVLKLKHIKPKTLKACLRAYQKEYIEGTDLYDQLDELRGKNLACFCKLINPCHVDILLKLANQD